MPSPSINPARYVAATTYTSTGRCIPSIAELDARLASRLEVGTHAARDRANTANEPARAQGEDAAAEEGASNNSQVLKEGKLFLKLHFWNEYQPQNDASQPQPKRKRNDSAAELVPAMTMVTGRKSRPEPLPTTVPIQQANQPGPSRPENSRQAQQPRETVPRGNSLPDPLPAPARAQPERKFARMKMLLGWRRPEPKVITPPADFDYSVKTGAGGPEKWKCPGTAEEVDKAWAKLREKHMSGDEFIERD